ncbi:zinc finger protein 506-like [Anneissia japonica]|uniref:zinc finger protein 506-like n=1 Tax=Anneissia japonica TaxID=1529436 RepID=UPI0014257CD0|nr:zinc finger protein 506-like [Anneissia japonica]
MPRVFLVKRRSQYDVTFPEDILQAQTPPAVVDTKSGSLVQESSIHRPISTIKLTSSKVFDFHEVEVFNKCHSQFHQSQHVGLGQLRYNESICEQVNTLKKEESINVGLPDYPEEFPKQNEIEMDNISTSMDTRFNKLEVKDMDPGCSSKEGLFPGEKYLRQGTTQSSFNPVLKAWKSSIPPEYVSEILAKQRQRILAKHVVNIQKGFFDLKKVSRRGRNNARQPIPGLEYIQNGTDMHYRNITSTQLSSYSTDSNSLERAKTTDGDLNESDGKQSQQRKYVCDICHKGFSRSNTLVTHKRIHTGDKPFACEVCGRAFRQPGNLTRHRLIHTTVKPYKCSQCGKAFNRASNLHTHMRTHTNYKPFVCQYCGKGFHQKIDMKIHSYTHTGEKPHKCKKCGRGFKQLTHLTYHMRTHSDVKMYTCTYCGKGFNQKGNLQAHIYGHTGERPYRCEICGKGFTLASTLNTHRRTHANRLAVPTFTAKALPFNSMHHGATNVE